jgi:uncharacterized protein (TIGR00730 family)
LRPVTSFGYEDEGAEAYLPTNIFMSMKTVCVYCASSTQIDSKYFQAASRLGSIFANAGVQVVFGGGCTGLMGALADSVLEAGGTITGVIPQFMCDEAWHHESLSELLVVDTMHERKEKMARMADAVVALPGGCGTLEELLEAITWKQLGIITSPIIILNTDGYYDALIEMLDKAVAERFMRDVHATMWSVVASPEDVLLAIESSVDWGEGARNLAAI